MGKRKFAQLSIGSQLHFQRMQPSVLKAPFLVYMTLLKLHQMDLSTETTAMNLQIALTMQRESSVRAILASLMSELEMIARRKANVQEQVIALKEASELLQEISVIHVRILNSV